MDRATLSLDGTWDFHFAGDDEIDPADIGSWRRCAVPMPWQAQFEDLRDRAGHGWYRRNLHVPAGWRAHRTFLCFGAVNYFTRVLVNGELIGEHEGGYLPFEFDVTDAVRVGEMNELLVHVIAPTDDPERYPAFPFAETPFGKQSWYGFHSGIWQSVRLERRSDLHLRPLRVQPDLERGSVLIQAELSRIAPSDCELMVRIEAPNGTLAAEFTSVVAAGRQSADLLIELSECHPWSPEDPALYRANVRLQCAEAGADSATMRFGFRKIEIRDCRLYLNDRPLFLRAALDQDYYADTITTTPSLAVLEDQFRKAKALGLNCVRCHIKAPDPRYYEAADRIGLLVWNDLPNCGRLTDAAAARAQRTLQGIVDRDSHHPSIICWTIVNENWGTDLVHDPEHRAWLKRMYEWLKAYDPTRLVVDNSPLWPSRHVQTDIEDMHFYTAIPDHRRAWDDFVGAMASGRLGTFDESGDAVRTGREPLIVSEFGNWGLPHPDDLKDAKGREPWWFETGHDWGEGVMYPHGIEHRFRSCGLDRVFGDLRTFVKATQWQQFAALKYQIEVMRQHPEIAGYVVTELTDCHWEANGLLDMRRNPRAFHGEFATVNADIVIVPQWMRTVYAPGDQVEIGISVANGGCWPLLDAELRWSLDGAASGHTTLDIGISEVRPAPTACFRLPQGMETGIRRLELELSVAGRVLATNHLDLSIVPARRDTDLSVFAAEPHWRQRLEALGYRMADAADADAIVAERLCGQTCGAIRDGARVLLVANQPMALEPAFPHWQNVRVLPRQGTPWQGDWASSFSWLDRREAFAGIPGGALLDHAFDRVIPDHVIAGCNSLDFQSRVRAGIVVGWIHKPAALIVERNYGKGRLVATTFRIGQDAPGADPMATALLDGLLALAAGKGYAAIRPRVDAATTRINS